MPKRGVQGQSEAPAAEQKALFGDRTEPERIQIWGGCILNDGIEMKRMKCVLPPLRANPVPLCVMDISIGTDHLSRRGTKKHSKRILEHHCHSCSINSTILAF